MAAAVSLRECERALMAGLRPLVPEVDDLRHRSEPAERHARIDQRDNPDRIEPKLPNEATDNTEANEPAEPMLRIEPAEPMLRIEPDEPIDRIEPLEPRLRMEPDESLLSPWTRLSQ